MTRRTDAIGSYGERVACQTLVDAGLTLLDRNWRCSTGELDLVARDGATVVFCEVKTRRTAAFGTPAEAVNAAKVRRLRALAVRWFAAHPQIHGEVRFDVICVRPQLSGRATVEHIRGAF